MSKISIHQWTQTLQASIEDRDLHSPFGERLPAFPDRVLQENTTGLSSEAAVLQAMGFYEETINALARRGVSIAPDWRLLDFGCGWGRISRCFMRDLPLAHISGIDVDQDFVTLSNQLFGGQNFSVCAPFPPTAVEPESVSLVSSYSVFSHLSGPACDGWIREFHRLLTPGGYVSITTRHISFFDYCDWAAKQGDAVQGYLAELGRLFPNSGEARRRYRSGELVHATSAGVSGGGPRNESFYGETFIPEAYFRKAYGDLFELVHFGFTPEKFDQAIIVLRKR